MDSLPRYRQIYKVALAGVLMCFVQVQSACVAAHSKWSFTGSIDAAIYGGNAEESWLSEQATGKHRLGNGEAHGIVQAISALRYDHNLKTGFHIEVAYHPDPDDTLGITQAFWHFKPLATQHWQSRYRVGAFHVPISLENPEALWLPRYTATPSMINTWVGEELRTIGAQGQWSWRASRRSKHKLSFNAAVFGANDTAGAMLAWRGWAAHNRQSVLGETIGLPELPVLEEGAPFAAQAPEFEPFVEVDNRPGYFVGTSWQYARQLTLSYFYYDNRGDPLALEGGQYAWDTRFHHIGLRYRPAKHWTIVAQWLTGNTVMGPGAVDNDFTSAFLLVSRKIRSHRLTARIEYFDVDDKDTVIENMLGNDIDPNDEHGERFTLGHVYRLNKAWQLSTELSQLRSNRDYREVFGERRKRTENQVLLQIMHRF